MSAPDSAPDAGAAEASEEKRLRERFGFLFLALIVVFLVEGIASEGDLKDAVITALVGAALAISFEAAEMPRRRLRRFVLLVALVVVAIIVAQVTGHDRVVTGITRLANGLLVSLAPAAVVIGVRRSLARHQEVSIEVVLGALCFYLLAGLFFAFLYGAINDLGGDPFFANGVSSTTAHNVYFSFTTLTTTGFGDLTARASLGHTLSNLEMLIGQIYLVTVVSIVVGNLRPRRGPRST